MKSGTTYVAESTFAQPTAKPLSILAYEAGNTPVAYIEPFAVGEPLPDMPLFVSTGVHVAVPLEETYQATWNVLPAVLRDVFGPSVG